MDVNPFGKRSAAVSSVTEGRMTTSSPTFQFAGVATCGVWREGRGEPRIEGRWRGGEREGGVRCYGDASDVRDASDASFFPCKAMDADVAVNDDGHCKMAPLIRLEKYAVKHSYSNLLVQ